MRKIGYYYLHLPEPGFSKFAQIHNRYSEHIFITKSLFVINWNIWTRRLKRFRCNSIGLIKIRSFFPVCLYLCSSFVLPQPQQRNKLIRQSTDPFQRYRITHSDKPTNPIGYIFVGDVHFDWSCIATEREPYIFDKISAFEYPFLFRGVFVLNRNIIYLFYYLSPIISKYNSFLQYRGKERRGRGTGNCYINELWPTNPLSLMIYRLLSSFK